jgi:hypothetical protein
VKKSCALEWPKLFKEGRESAEDDERIGRPRYQRTDENFEKVRNLMHSDRRLNITAMAVQII